MNLVKKNWHQDVIAALDMAREEVQKADEQIRKAGANEMVNGNKKVATDALKYSDTLDGFLFELDKLCDKWQEIQELIDADRTEVQEVVLPTTVRNIKGGYKRKVVEVAPWTNLTVTIDNSPLIVEPTAKAVFVKVLSFFDLEKVAKLGVMLNGEPLLSQDKNDFSKYPQSAVEVKNGWFVSTYCSTATKAKFIREFAKEFGKKAEVTIIPRKNKNSRANLPSPALEVGGVEQKQVQDDGRVVPGVPFKVSQVVLACFPEVFKRGLVTQKEVDFLLTKESSKHFKTGGWAVLLPNRGIDEDRYVRYANGNVAARYYQPITVTLTLNGKRYYLSSQFMPKALTPVVAWLKEKGFSKNDICDLIKGSNQPNLFPVNKC